MMVCFLLAQIPENSPPECWIIAYRKKKEKQKQKAQFARGMEIKCHRAAPAIRHDVTATVAASQDVVRW